MLRRLRRRTHLICIKGKQDPELSVASQDEDEIKAQLRALTEQTSKLRQELRAGVSPSPQGLARALTHIQLLRRDKGVDAPAASGERRRKHRYVR